MAIAAALPLLLLAQTASAGIPDVTNSYYVPQAGAVSNPYEGTLATRFFRVCPNNDGGASLPLHARIKITVRDVNNMPLPDVPAADICILFNGGTTAQGFTGVGADSIIANSQYNPSPLCPDVRCLYADAPTGADGTTYITFAGADPANPGVTARNPNRKWGHYDSALRVYVSGYQLSGRLTTASPNGTYTLRIKNIDHVGGLGTRLNAGAVVSSLDYNSMVYGLTSNDPTNYWRDLDGNNAVGIAEINMISAHMSHDCDTPINP